MTDPERVQETLRRLVDSQPFAVLATHDGGQPHASLVAFAATDDLQHLLFATDRRTRKFINLAADPRAAMLVDRRPGGSTDVEQGVSVTFVGEAAEVVGPDRDRLLETYVSRHPDMSDFARSPSSALVRMTIGAYEWVRGLSNVKRVEVGGLE